MIRLKVLGVLCLALMFVPTTMEQWDSRTDPIVFSKPPKVVLSTTTTIPTTTTTTTSITTTTTIPPTTTTSTESMSPVVSSSTSRIWDEFCTCECGGVCNWSTQGGLYEGGLQFHPDTWSDYVASGKPYGLIGYPAHAYEATREQQIVVAERVRDGVPGSSDPYLNPQGYGAWPTCRHEVGV